MIIETEGRFWNWDIKRWENDMQLRSLSNGWDKGLPPSTKGYSSCPAEIVTMVTDHANRDAMLPFRRREYEFNAMIREVLRRSSLHPDVIWGSIMPKNEELAKVCGVFLLHQSGLLSLAKQL